MCNVPEHLSGYGLKTLLKVTEAQEYIPLINCIMNSDFPPEACESCLEMLDITTTSSERVRECAESEEGSKLLHDIGIETQSLEPALTGVPWLLFNEVSEKSQSKKNKFVSFQEFDRDNWIQGMNDLKALLCDEYLTDSTLCKN